MCRMPAARESAPALAVFGRNFLGSLSPITAKASAMSGYLESSASVTPDDTQQIVLGDPVCLPVPIFHFVKLPF
jgi:hypothetical protein